MTRPTMIQTGERPATTEADEIDIRERGRNASGEAITLDRRLFMQFMAFGNCQSSAEVAAALTEAQVRGALYEDVNDPQGIGLVTYSETPDYFISDMRRLLNQVPFSHLTPKPEHTMLGRTYAIGYEPDLVEALLTRPIRRVVDPALSWVIWYPLRRAGSFEQLSAQEQNVILAEHGGIGRAYGRAGLGHDIRLACHGLDKNDNDFVIGLLGSELYPLSTIVQRMRKTKQTSLHLERLGPFFVGKVVWQGK
jgi:Chlorite dismutase